MKKVIGLVAALPDEIKQFTQLFDKCQKRKLGRFRIYKLSKVDCECVVIESGMGTKNAAEATVALINKFDPAFIINFGFAGAILPGLAVGDIVVAGRILLCRDRLFSEQEGIAETTKVSTIIDRVLEPFNRRVVTGAFITSDRQLRKSDIARLLPRNLVHPVLEMESSAVARVAAKQKVPFIALRSITDTSDQELSFDLAAITNRQRKISLVRLLFAVLKKPSILLQLPRLASSARTAGKSLGIALLPTIELCVNMEESGK